MMIATIGIDLAKNVFQVHGVDERGQVALRKQVRREQLTTCMVNLPPWVVGMEACGGAHHGARKFQELGHTVRLMSPQFVKPYVKSNKNDAADAAAICEAVTRPHMRFVPIKSVEQQAVLSMHRVRQGFVAARTGQANQIRGVLAELGIVLPKGIGAVRTQLMARIDQVADRLPGVFLELMRRLREHFAALDRQVSELEGQIKQWHRNCKLSQRLEKIPGVGPITATALVASIADARSFKNGRQLAAWLGLVPRQHSSGGNAIMYSFVETAKANGLNPSSTTSAFHNIT